MTDNRKGSWPMYDAPTPEQAARDMLERMGVDDAQSWSAGEVVEVANLIDEVDELRDTVAELRKPPDRERTPVDILDSIARIALAIERGGGDHLGDVSSIHAALISLIEMIRRQNTRVTATAIAIDDTPPMVLEALAPDPIVTRPRAATATAPAPGQSCAPDRS